LPDFRALDVSEITMKAAGRTVENGVDAGIRQDAYLYG
jgi:hypothetical protein